MPQKMSKLLAKVRQHSEAKMYEMMPPERYVGQGLHHFAQF